MILIWCALGALAGTITGLIPGLHTNNVAALLMASPFFGAEITAFMLSMCIVQTFVDFVPSIYLGAPSPDTFEGVLPGHKMFMEGRAHEAICLTVFGGIIAVAAGAALTPLFFLLIAQNSETIMLFTPGVLGFALAMMAWSENGRKKKATAAFAMGAAAMQGMLFPGQIFPLITGYFGIATIAYSLKEKSAQAKQKGCAEIEKKFFSGGLIGMAGGALVAVMPGIGSNVAAGMIRAFTEKISQREYLVLVGSINTSNFFFSFATLFALSKARNGAMIALQEKMIPYPEMLWAGTMIMLMAGGIGGLIAMASSKKAAAFFTREKARIASISTIAFMAALVGALNGAPGLIALAFSTALGLFVAAQKVKRTTCMASLIVPALFFYVFILI